MGYDRLIGMTYIEAQEYLGNILCLGIPIYKSKNIRIVNVNGQSLMLRHDTSKDIIDVEIDVPFLVAKYRNGLHPPDWFERIKKGEGKIVKVLNI